MEAAGVSCQWHREERGVRMAFHLAQVNIGRMLAPLDSATMAGFVAELNPINALADRSPGFVWRLQTAGGDATSLRPFDDDLMIVNLSVWQSLESLRAFAFGGRHREVMLQRRAWFERMRDAYVALWWVPADHLPDVAEARERLDHLRAHGPTPHAFTFAQTFAAEEVAAFVPLAV